MWLYEAHTHTHTHTHNTHTHTYTHLQEHERWRPKDALATRGTAEPPIGSEEWLWLGPDPKRSDGQANL